MKIRYNKSPIYNIILFITITVTGLFSVVNTPILSDYNMRYNITFILTLFLFFVCMINQNIKNATKQYTTIFYGIMVYVAIFTVVHCFYAAIHYDQGFRSLYATAKYFVMMIVFVPFVFVMDNNNGYETILRSIAIITLTIAFFNTVKAFAFDFAGIHIFRSIAFDLRYNRMRIGLPAFGPLTFVYIVDKFLKTKRNQRDFYVYIALIIYMIFYVFYINMTRMNIIGYLLILAVMLLFKKRPKNKQIISVFLILLFITFVLTSDTFSAFVSSFSESADELGSSTLARNIANEYFKQFTDENSILGLGFLCPDTPIREAIMFGPDHNCSLDDLGIRNMYWHYGISGIILAVLVFGRMLYLVISIVFFSNCKNKLIVTGITVYAISTQVSLCLFDPQRILALLMYWAIFEYEYAQNRRVKQKFQAKKLFTRREQLLEQQ